MKIIHPTTGNKAQRAELIRVVENFDDCVDCLKDIVWEGNQGGVVGIDCETVGIDPRKESPVGRGRIVCWSLATRRARWFLWADALEYFTPWLEDESTPKVGHNVFTFDRHIFSNHSISLNGIVGDTRYMARYLKADKRFSVSLKSLMKVLFGYELGEYKELFSRPSASGKINKRKRIGSSRRKIGDRYIPTVLGFESHNVSFKRQELIPLDTIKESYPERLGILFDYATLDAKATREIYFQIRRRLERKSAPKL